MQTRKAFFDNIKSFLICLVVFGHVISPFKFENEYILTIYQWVFLFHMPAFIFISGYFTKGFYKTNYYKKIIMKLLLPYLILQTAYTVYYNIITDDIYRLQYFVPRWAMWYLVSMILWKILLPIFAKMKWHMGLFISVICGLGIGYVDGIDRFLSLDRTFYFFPFFLLGYYFPKNLIKKYYEKTSRFFPIIVFIIISTIGLLLVKGNPLSTLYGTYVYQEHRDLVYRLLQYMISMVMIFLICFGMTEKKRWFTKFGEESFYIYIYHGFILKGLLEIAIAKELLMSCYYIPTIIVSIIIIYITSNLKYLGKLLRSLKGKVNDITQSVINK